ncbi:uncharacterized protein ACRADG_007365 [Cochliomyia hominivorax]
MYFSTVCKSVLITLLLLGTLSAPSDGVKVIFYSKPSVLTSQLLITDNRSKPCPKGHLRDHRNRCRRALTFSHLTRKK